MPFWLEQREIVESSLVSDSSGQGSPLLDSWRFDFGIVFVLVIAARNYLCDFDLFMTLHESPSELKSKIVQAYQNSSTW